MIEDNEICCSRMKLEIDSFNKKEVYTGDQFKEGFLCSSIWYDESRRWYNILSYSEVDNYYGSPIDFCPFCGAKLPSRLDPDDCIEEEYGFDYLRYSDEPEYKELPPDIRKEFDTDLWWKKRGL